MIDGLETSDIREMIEIPPDSSMGDFGISLLQTREDYEKSASDDSSGSR